ncbi:hypothetical protein MGG_18112 [Pyricularia oryzae 70-15]|uniref:Uncharacterized protein n=1 Tax=Pyricularia oryzae (strain 70-15 / ATCC MYA-4617 / FGSC 8958) TaxID=242507 RepID=A0A151V4H6_PYRO7|nr:uncharacterized protein MGG_18112 [Pyricularia oryzae 70-15]KYQ30477.1 hypothetical protein MGG_18112 [Pyricularia oryzae 70-15]
MVQSHERSTRKKDAFEIDHWPAQVAKTSWHLLDKRPFVPSQPAKTTDLDNTWSPERTTVSLDPFCSRYSRFHRTLASRPVRALYPIPLKRPQPTL